MTIARRWQRWLVAGILVGLASWPIVGLAEDRPTIHHAGVLRSVDVAAGILVIDERVRLAPPLLTQIHVTGETVMMRVKRVGGEFRGERVRLDELKIGEYLVVRGVDQGIRHHAEMVWSLGPAE